MLNQHLNSASVTWFRLLTLAASREKGPQLDLAGKWSRDSCSPAAPEHLLVLFIISLLRVPVGRRGIRHVSISWSRRANLVLKAGNTLIDLKARQHFVTYYIALMTDTGGQLVHSELLSPSDFIFYV
ncbi:hypothetical protein RRG08_049895 [Elysia crispata]|uniref:Uncharacterized protein n=1 Tax=Elysia crispata TaxID=231223 RepID=A0AAE0Y0P4_9GAST|nr:hypothetical protein RRG08_049895 [Elysia crispata]